MHGKIFSPSHGQRLTRSLFLSHACEPKRRTETLCTLSHAAAKQTVTTSPHIQLIPCYFSLLSFSPTHFRLTFFLSFPLRFDNRATTIGTRKKKSAAMTTSWTIFDAQFLNSINRHTQFNVLCDNHKRTPYTQQTHDAHVTASHRTATKWTVVAEQRILCVHNSLLSRVLDDRTARRR